MYLLTWIPLDIFNLVANLLLLLVVTLFQLDLRVFVHVVCRAQGVSLSAVICSDLEHLQIAPSANRNQAFAVVVDTSFGSAQTYYLQVGHVLVVVTKTVLMRVGHHGIVCSYLRGASQIWRR